jgi:ABC-type multidrug transport system ATPase subunit
MRIELRNVSKRYGAIRALDRVSFELEPGQTVAVLGTNGAGKTTLIRCLAGIVGTDTGTVHYDGEWFRRDRIDLRRRLAYLPDSPVVFWEQNALQHIGMVARAYGLENAGLEERILELLRDLDLLPIALKPLHQLSRGQIYKAALAALIAIDPELWLLDEPFASGMDPQGSQTLRRHAADAIRRGRTVLYSTQILEVAERFADRICVLQDGQLRAFATLESLRAQARGEAGPLETLFRQLRD